MAHRDVAPGIWHKGLFLVVALWCGVVVAGEVLQTNDGLRLEFSEQGRISRMAIGPASLPLTAAGGFSVADCQSPAAVINLIPNAGFEAGPQGWRLEKGQALDTAVAHGGRASIRLEVPGPEPGTTNLGIVVPVKPYTAYRVGLWYRRHHAPSGRGGSPAVFYSELDEQGRHLGVYQVGASLSLQDDQWLPVSWNVVTGPETRKLLLRGTLFQTTGTLWLDDFLIAEDVEVPYAPALGTLRREPDHSLRHQASLPELGLEVEASYRLQADAIRVDGTVRDLTGRDRAIGVRFGLPLDLTGWRWYDDAEDYQTIGPKRTHQNTFACEAGIGACSMYPWSAVTGSQAGLSLALPLEQGPRVFVLRHDQKVPETSATFYFGLSKDAGRNPSRATFSLVLYAHDLAWGMRSAMDRYYRLFPESFKKRPPYEGYLNYGHIEPYRPDTHELVLSRGQVVPDASDFGEGYEFIWAMHGCYDYHQFPTDDRSMPKDELVKQWLAAKAGHRESLYTPEPETLKKLVYGPEGQIRYIFDTQYWRSHEGYNLTDKPGWGLNFRVHEDPDVSPFLADLTRKKLEQYAAKPGGRPFSACLTADAIDGYFSATSGLDYRREHFGTTLSPLTFGRQNLKPAIFNSIWDFHKKAWWPLSEQHQVVTYGNGNVPSAFATMPFIDIAMVEGRWGLAAKPREERFWRAAAFHKIWRFWCLNTGWYTIEHALDPKEVGRAFGEGLASAVFPPLDTVRSVLGSLEPCRAAYRQYVPAIEELSAAGWEPVPYASADSGAVVERFGSAERSSLCFTLRNYADQPKQVSLRLDRLGLKLPAGAVLVAVDLVPGTPEVVSLQGDVLTARIEADNSRAFWVGTRDQLAVRGLLQATAVVDRIERLFATELDPAATRLLDQFRQTARSLAARPQQEVLRGTEVLQTLAGRIEQEIRTKSPVDLAKLVFRLRTHVSLAPLALLDVRSQAPRLVESALRGESVSVAWKLTGESVANPANGRVQVLSSWPELAADSRMTTVGQPSNAATLQAALSVPAEPKRSLLPFLLVYRGEAQGVPFTLVTPVDVAAEESAQREFAPDSVVRGVPSQVQMRLTNRQAQPAKVRVKFTPPQHIELSPTDITLDLPAASGARHSLTIHATSKCMLGKVWVPYTVESDAVEHNSRGRMFLRITAEPSRP